MYSTEKTLNLLWEGSKTSLSLLPTVSRERPRSPFIRSRSPSPEGPRGPSRFTNRPDRQYIQYDSLKVLNDLEEPLKDWREVSEDYITSTLNISHGLPYKILNIFIKGDHKVLFKVLVYELHLDTITTTIINSIQLPITILDVSITDKYSVTPNNSSIRVNCCLSDIPIFKIMGRDKFSFTVQLNELDDSNKKCFDAFRNLCKCDKILNDLFEKCIYDYLERSRNNVSAIVYKFMDVTK